MFYTWDTKRERIILRHKRVIEWGDFCPTRRAGHPSASADILPLDARVHKKIRRMRNSAKQDEL